MSDKDKNRRARLSKAIRLLLLDKDKQYDEYLVTRLFDLVASLEKDDAEVVIKCLSDVYSNDDQLTNANYSRLLRLHGDVLVHTVSATSDDLDRHAKYLRDKMPFFITQTDQNCLVALLDLLQVYLEIDPGCEYIIETPFVHSFTMISPVNGRATQRSYTITNCLDLIRYCLDFYTNCEVLEAARGFMLSLIQKSYCSPLKPFDEEVGIFIEDLMSSGNHQIYICMRDLMSLRTNNTLGFYHHSCRPIIKKSFDKAIRENNTKELVTLAAIMSFVTEVKDAGAVIEALKRVKNMKAIIAFVTSNIDYIADCDVMKYVLYPILAQCNSDDAQVLIPRLHITREEGIFIDTHLQEEYLVHCLRFIDDFARLRITGNQFHIPIPHRRQMFVFDVVLEYVKSHQLSCKCYKNLLQSLSILDHAPHILFRRSEILWLFKFVIDIFGMLSKLDKNEPMHIPFIVGYIRLLKESLHKLTYFRNCESYASKVSDYFMRVVSLAFNYDDCDILDEFVSLFSKNAFQFILSKGGENLNNQHEQYVKLVWHHIRKNALQGDHQELLGTVTDLLIAIDLYVETNILERQGITKRQDIPRYLGDVLIDYSSRIQTVEAVIERLRCARIEEVDRPLNRGSEKKMTYLCFLDIGSKPVRESLDHVVRGLCLTARGECTDKIRMRAMDELCGLIDEFMINEVESPPTLRRLARTGILETLYDITNGSLYSVEMRQITCGVVLKIQSLGMNHLNNRRDELLKLMNEEIPQIERLKLEKMVNFYSSDDFINDIVRNLTEEDINVCCDNTIDTFIDHVINQDENDHCFTSDCH